MALKLVRPQGGVDALTERLRRESRLQARSAHRAVITVHDIGRADDQVYVAMDLIHGTTVREWLAARRGHGAPWSTRFARRRAASPPSSPPLARCALRAKLGR